MPKSEQLRQSYGSRALTNNESTNLSDAAIELIKRGRLSGSALSPEEPSAKLERSHYMIVKLSGIVVVVLSVVAILCTGCASPTYEPSDDSSVLTEEEQWSALIAESSAFAASASEESSTSEESSISSGESSAFVSSALIDGLRS